MSGAVSEGAAATVLEGISFASVVLARDIADRHGVLVYVEDALAMLLVRLDDEAYAEIRGFWSVEVAFGSYDRGHPQVFASLGAAAAWLTNVNADGGAG